MACVCLCVSVSMSLFMFVSVSVCTIGMCLSGVDAVSTCQRAQLLNTQIIIVPFSGKCTMPYIVLTHTHTLQLS
ncbi:hypothetical protein GQ44DRAFT_705825 [Phaeosphaeriaceae sp. PMI808]|nr:hypothetical protein GQ44DRAFT_705825 [Phaeosphaeriaceae sp. PMI808]